jgi:hypothetical protein
MLKTVTNIIDASQIKTPITLPGDVTLSTGNLVIGTSGKGIDFSATPGTGTSELLDDYEEGTFSPSIQRTASNATITYTTRKGWYTKVGDVVHCDIAIAWSANSGGSGYWELQDMPFVNKNVADHYSQAVTNDISNFTYPAGTTQIGVALQPNRAAGAFIASGSGITGNVITTVGNTGSVYLSITYLAS